MAIAFQVTARTESGSVPPRKKPAELSENWSAVIRIFVGMSIGTFLFVAVLIVTGSNYAFVLLPVFLSLFITASRGYKFSAILTITPLYFLLTACLTLLFYGFVVAGVLLTHPGSGFAPIILVTAGLAWAVICEPARVYFQSLIERRFNQRHRRAARAIETFTSTLREEIDLVQLRERFLTVIQLTMQPYSLSFWVRVTERKEEVTSADEIVIAAIDPLMAYLLDHSGVTEIEWLQFESPFLRAVMKVQGTAILLPLTSQGELIGLLTLGLHQDGGEYTRSERALLQTLASQMVPALRVAQMVREQQQRIREHERIEQELRTARVIQRTFLPGTVPAFPGWQLAPYYQPAREVGGDFYDFLLFEDGRLGLVIGDVTGKGVPAALVMATVHTMLRSTARQTTSPSEVLAKVNTLLVAEIPAGMFVTCFYALLDPCSGRICYANAGHEAPYRCLNGSASELFASGMPLGMLPDTDYEEQEATLNSGESLLFYSDGLVEAHNSVNEMFGFPRLQTMLAAHDHETSLIDFVLNELQTFTGKEWEQEDDVTLLLLQRTRNEAL